MSWDRYARRVSVIKSWRQAREMYLALVAERDTVAAERDAVVFERDALCRDRAMLEQNRDVLERELVDIRARHRELYASVLARYECWAELARLHRERQIDRALKVERDSGQPLH